MDKDMKKKLFERVLGEILMDYDSTASDYDYADLRDLLYYNYDIEEAYTMNMSEFLKELYKSLEVKVS